jgi:hypothetical protein
MKLVDQNNLIIDLVGESTCEMKQIQNFANVTQGHYILQICGLYNICLERKQRAKKPFNKLKAITFNNIQ